MRRAVLLFLLFLTVACNNEMVSDKYCSLYARFTFTPVNSISQLYSSCESMGEWCTITINGGSVYFTKADGSQGMANITADVMYKGMYPGLSGFIVGLPNIPELGTTYSVVTCYDLACRNCYEEAVVAKPMKLLEGGYSQCLRCKRIYDLNNTGSCEQGKPLYRYRVYYGNNTLSVDNR